MAKDDVKAHAAFDAARAEQEKLHADIYYDIRNAFLDWSQADVPHLQKGFDLKTEGLPEVTFVRRAQLVFCNQQRRASDGEHEEDHRRQQFGPEA
jgi:hypothetical protein